MWHLQSRVPEEHLARAMPISSVFFYEFVFSTKKKEAYNNFHHETTLSLSIVSCFTI